MADVVFEDGESGIVRRQRMVLRNTSWKPYGIAGVVSLAIVLGAIVYFFRAHAPVQTLQEKRFTEWMNQGNAGAPPDYFMPQGM